MGLSVKIVRRPPKPVPAKETRTSKGRADLTAVCVSVDPLLLGSGFADRTKPFESSGDPLHESPHSAGSTFTNTAVSCGFAGQRHWRRRSRKHSQRVGSL